MWYSMMYGFIIIIIVNVIMELLFLSFCIFRYIFFLDSVLIV